MTEPTKFVIVSDLHLESCRGVAGDLQHKMNTWFEGDYTDCVAVFAGDILTRYEAPEFLESYRAWFRDIIFIPGNHDLWGADTSCVGRHYLDMANKVKIIDDVVVISAVGWPYHDRIHPLSQIDWSNGLYEEDYIRGMTWDWWCEQAQADFEFIKTVLETVPGRKKIVITHYPPISRCNNPLYANSPMNPLFVSGHEEFLQMSAFAPDIWISGHTHWRWDFQFANTRLIGNCLGYHNELKEKYQPQVIFV